MLNEAIRVTKKEAAGRATIVLVSTPNATGWLYKLAMQCFRQDPIVWSEDTLDSAVGTRCDCDFGEAGVIDRYCIRPRYGHSEKRTHGPDGDGKA